MSANPQSLSEDANGLSQGRVVAPRAVDHGSVYIRQEATPQCPAEKPKCADCAGVDGKCTSGDAIGCK